MVTREQLTRDLGGIAIVIGLLLAVTFLPPDTSLSEARAKGAIRACVPPLYPPLVTGDAERPGIDIEILRAVADHVGVRLLLASNDAIGRDFNPRHWNVTRGTCEVLAGGVVDSPLTRSFLDVGPSYAETGWAIIAPEPLGDIEGRTLGALTLISGLDRIGLASYLRSKNVTVRVVRSREELVAGIAAGTLDGGVSEALQAAELGSQNGWWDGPLPTPLARYDLVFGLWKGDLTLKKEIEKSFRDLQSDGTLETILRRYGVEPLGELRTTSGVPSRSALIDRG